MNYKVAMVGSSSINSNMSSGTMTSEGNIQHKAGETLKYNSKDSRK